MNTIVVFGAGKSATCLIEYLVKETANLQWKLIVADGDVQVAQSKIGNSSSAQAVGLHVEDDAARTALIQQASIVISLLPPHLHIMVARDCVQYGKNLLTASYIDPAIKELEPAIKEKGLLFLCEMGLDPGIDHMSAMQLIHEIHGKGGVIHSFVSHCGGLVAPESDDNPWHYKISWNPRNIVQAGKAGAQFKLNDKIIQMKYEDLFDANRVVAVPDLPNLAWYPNRDSLSYMSLYGLEQAKTFIRTTLRYPEFSFGWKHVIDLKLTDETPAYETDGLTLQAFFQQHLTKHGFSDWLEKQLTSRLTKTKELLEKLQELLKAEENVEEDSRAEIQEFMAVDDDGNLKNVNLDKVKTTAAATVVEQMHEANLAMKQLFFLGMDDNETLINKGYCSAMDVLQFAMERKLALGSNDKDMIVMLHEFEYSVAAVNYATRSCLIVKGKDPLRTAMAQTVGLPLGIAAKLILQGTIREKGLHIPVLPGIYTPVLKELEMHGVRFSETNHIL